MSQNEEHEEADNVELEEPEDLPKEGEEGYDKINWKEVAEKNRGIAQRNATKLKKLKEAKPEAKEPKIKPPVKKAAEVEKENADDRGFDRVDRSILRAEKITDEDELDLVSDIMKETGKDVEAVVASKYFQSELKALREEKTVANATPRGSGRTNNSAKGEVDYWIAKGELPPMDQPALRQKVVNAKIAAKRGENTFSKNPIL